VTKRLSEALAEIGNTPGDRERAEKMLSDPATNTPVEFAEVRRGNRALGKGRQDRRGKAPVAGAGALRVFNSRA